MFAPGDLFGSYEVAGPLHRPRLASLNQPTIGGIYGLEEAHGIPAWSWNWSRVRSCAAHRVAGRNRVALDHDEFQPFVALDLDNKWESKGVLRPYQLAIPFRRSIRGEHQSGERAAGGAFEVSDGIVIPPGRDHWKQYRLEVATAQKRRLYAQVTWWFGGFYTGWAGVALRSRWLISSRMSVPHRLPAVHRVLAALVAVAMPVLSALAVIRAPNG